METLAEVPGVSPQFRLDLAIDTAVPDEINAHPDLLDPDEAGPTNREFRIDARLGLGPDHRDDWLTIFALVPWDEIKRFIGSELVDQVTGDRLSIRLRCCTSLSLSH